MKRSVELEQEAKPWGCLGVANVPSISATVHAMRWCPRTDGRGLWRSTEGGTFP